jgi:signal transduction histidine kinase
LRFFERLFSSDFMPHGYCYLWKPGIIWLHVVSDSVITLSYYCIPFILVYIVRKRKDLPFNWMFLMFGLFILGCGTTHLMEVWTVWHATYLLAGIIKAVTALVSVVTALLLIPLVPKALLMPSHKDVEALNLTLESRNAELQEANKELESFSYSVSHDLRAPLRHLTGFSKLLQEEYTAGLDATAQRYLQAIQKDAKNMGDLVDGLLDLGRFGRQPLARERTDLNALAHAVISDVEFECARRQVEWRVGQLPIVSCDPLLIKQVFMNLFSNALKYSRRREHTIIEVDQTICGGKPVIFVRDNGAGFDQRYAHKLFGVFQRLHRADEFEGTGVGLATVHRIIRRHGGRIWAEGKVDNGATFFFELPDEDQIEALSHSGPVSSAQ